jgi:hypothetical protein
VDKATRKQYGPYELIGMSGLSPACFLSLPWVDVCGAQISVAVQDNFADLGIVASWRALAIAEIAIDGVLGGFPQRLKTQQVRQISGPLTITFPWEAAFDEIKFCARTMIGGIPQPISTLPANASLQANVFLVPRGGFNLVRGKSANV